MTARPLLDDLRRKAAAETDAVRASAQAEAEQVRQSARAAAEARATAERQRAARAEAEQSAVAHADAQRRANERLLPARAAALERVFLRATARIESRANDPRLGEALAPLVRDALGYLSEGAIRARCASPVVQLVQQTIAAAGRTDASVSADPAVPLGAIVELADGSVAVDATFAQRLAKERPVLAAELAARLQEPAP